MQGFWLTVGWGLASLLAVSVLVALIEFLRQGSARPPAVESPLPRAMKVDVDIDALPADPPARAAQAVQDPETRRLALSEVLQRLQQGGPEAAWVETTPMVLAPKPTDATAP